jgi:hypothetical protein
MLLVVLKRLAAVATIVEICAKTSCLASPISSDPICSEVSLPGGQKTGARLQRFPESAHT